MDKRLMQTKEFLNYCQVQRRLSSDTIRVYTYDLKLFNVFLDNLGKPITDFSEVTKETLQAYLRSLASYQVKSIKHKFACIRSLFNFLEYEEKIETNPFYRFHLNIREPYKVRTAMTIEEMERLLLVAYKEMPETVPDLLTEKNPRKLKITSEEFKWLRNITVLELLFAGGLRVSELCSLKLDDINLKHLAIMIHGKGNKERLVFLENKEVILAINQYLSFRKEVGIDLPYVFITKFGQKLSTQAVRDLVTKFAALSGLNKKITPHVFRHTFASLLLEEGVDIKYIQDFLGHSSISTTQIYLHTTNRQKRKIIATQHPREKLYFSNIPSTVNVKLTS